MTPVDVEYLVTQPHATSPQVAAAYAKLLQSYTGRLDKLRVGDLNAAITARWGLDELELIRLRAWQLADAHAETSA